MLFQVVKGLEGNPKLTGRNAEDLAWSRLGIPAAKLPLIAGCLEIPTQAAAPVTPKEQAGKEKYTELIQCFP